ncbi:VWA domain-containing protein [Amycolatopsis kentuckyensis]|uniref:VWA domain-containing protein n=1 Tax=Amycolatopsis kentuckyensis TaxID=218823 RepID=UPI001302CA29|nr:vWA domain-containing protein [Amycolatopsis kentuckyensis]
MSIIPGAESLDRGRATVFIPLLSSHSGDERAVSGMSDPIFRRGGKWWRATAIFGVIGLLLALQLPTAGNASAQEPSKLPPVQVVVLMDESGSLSETDVVQEKEAARTIVFSALAPGSVVSVVGFGSSDGPGQSAVQVACPPTLLDNAQSRDSLAKCVGNLHRRTSQEGDGTDHVAALQQALAFVGATQPEKKLVFLLTDGKLDVSNSPSWGDTPARRNGAATAKVGEVLTELDRAGAQVWPLGFGAVDNALRGFAKGRSCTPAAADPHEQIARSPEELASAVQEAFSSASCVKYGPRQTGNVPKGGSTELTVDIPAVASYASILVYKRDPRVQVEYLAPGASEPAPAAGGSNFEFAGQTTETESLRISDPEPGKWTIRLSSADVPAQDVAATVAYQAAVKAYLTVSPPQPAAGQTVDVDMQVWARGRAVVDPSTLQSLTFTLTLTGKSGFPAQPITLADPDHDGTFGGQVKVPADASGELAFSGQVSGIGIGGDTRVLSTKVQGGVAAVQGQILFDSNRAAVTPGGTISGTVSVTNNSGRPAPLRLEVSAPSPGTTLTVNPAVVQAQPGVTKVPFVLRFGAGTALGTNAATLRLVKDSGPPDLVAERLFTTDVAPEPGIVEKLFWLWVGLAVLVAAAVVFAVVKIRARREAVRVRGLRAQLVWKGSVSSELEPPNPRLKSFVFVLHDAFTGPQLQPANANDPDAYQVRRAGTQLSLIPPGQQPVVLTPGARHDLGRDRALVVLDERGAGDGLVNGGPVPPISYSPFDGPAGSDSSSTYTDPLTDPPAPWPADAGFGSPRADPDPGDPFTDDPFGSASEESPRPGNGSSGGSNRGSVPFDAGAYADPNNPFS